MQAEAVQKLAWSKVKAKTTAKNPRHCMHKTRHVLLAQKRIDTLYYYLAAVMGNLSQNRPQNLSRNYNLWYIPFPHQNIEGIKTYSREEIRKDQIRSLALLVRSFDANKKKGIIETLQIVIDIEPFESYLQ